MKIKIAGFDMAYELMGKVVPPIVLIHGFGLNRSIWRNLASAYLGDQQVILPDVRGHGESGITPGAYPMSLLAEDLAQLLEYLGIEQAIVCGHSMGGYITLAFAQDFPHMLAGLGLITTNAAADSEEKRAGRYSLINQIRERSAIALADSLAPRLSQDPAVTSLAHELICKANPEGLIGAAGGMAERPDFRALLPRINVPALVVAGEMDQITDLAGAKSMAEVLPQAEFLCIPNAGHMPMLEAPAELVQGLQFLIARVMM